MSIGASMSLGSPMLALRMVGRHAAFARLARPTVAIIALLERSRSMPANRFNGHTNLGVGIGLRIPHYNHILTKKPTCDWFEIISENYMVDGGRPLHILDQIMEQYQVV